MVAPANASHHVFSGQLSGGEIFSFGMWFEYTSGSPANYAGSFEAWVQSINTDLSSLVNNCIDSSSRLTKASGYLYDGVSRQASRQAEVALNLPGVSASAYPNQVAAVVTVRSGLPGRRYRGRIYLPQTVAQAAIHSPEQMGPAKLTSLTTLVASIMNAGPAAGFSPMIVSTTYTSMVPVVEVTADSKLDTQRRRAEAMPAASSASAPVGQV